MLQALVIGFGVSGQSAAKMLLDLGYSVLAVDKKCEGLLQSESVQALQRKGLSLRSDQLSLPSSAFDLAVISPGIPLTHPCCQEMIRRGVELVSEIELACRFIDRPFLGITGTNGKTTVTLMTAHVLNRLGVCSQAMGNSGVPLTKAHFSDDPTETIALELSSYQLETTQSPFLTSAIVLNITPDHLDRYGTMEPYAAAKLKIFTLVKGSGERWIHEKAYDEFRSQMPDFNIQLYGDTSRCDLRRCGSQVIYKEKVAFLLPKLYEEGFRHDVENIMAAYALCRPFCDDGELFLDALASFKKPPHRLEHVRNWNGIDFFDDSKGTNIDAVVRAVEALDRPIVLIAGGVDKNTGYAPWIQAFKGKVKGICVIGEASVNINKELAEYYSVKQYRCLQSAVQGAVEMSEKGDAVLLSPGCASMDMFKDYADRGNQFTALVKAL